jgi:hypothetical protein
MAFSFPASFSRLQKGIWNLKTIALLVRAAIRGRNGCDPVAVSILYRLARASSTLDSVVNAGVEAAVSLSLKTI